MCITAPDFLFYQPVEKCINASVVEDAPLLGPCCNVEKFSTVSAKTRFAVQALIMHDDASEVGRYRLPFSISQERFDDLHL